MDDVVHESQSLERWWPRLGPDDSDFLLVGGTESDGESGGNGEHRGLHVEPTSKGRDGVFDPVGRGSALVKGDRDSDQESMLGAT